MSYEISRRDVLKGTAAVVAGAGIAGCTADAQERYDRSASNAEERITDWYGLESDVYVEGNTVVAEVEDGFGMNLCPEGGDVDREDMAEYLRHEDNEFNVPVRAFESFETHLPYATFTVVANEFAEYMPHSPEHNVSEDDEQALADFALRIEGWNDGTAVFTVDEERVYTQYYTSDKPLSDSREFEKDFKENFQTECQ